MIILTARPRPHVKLTKTAREAISDALDVDEWIEERR